MSNRLMTIGVSVVITTMCVVLLVLLRFGWLGGGSMVPEAIRRIRDDPIPRIDPSDDDRALSLFGRKPSLRHQGRAGWIEVGGVMRPQEDVKGVHDDGVNSSTLKRLESTLHAGRRLAQRIGRSPPVHADTTPQTRSVARALADRSHPERLTRFISPAPFDRRKFVTAPQEYLNAVEPGRIFQSAQPAPEVSPIVRLGTRFKRIVQGDAVELSVRATPRMPVTFYSPALGVFSSGLSTITVAANDAGVASVSFRATPGTHGDIDLIAVSPVHSNQARFTVHVALPEPIARIPTGASGPREE